MIVTLDGHRVEGSFGAPATLTHLIDQVRATHAGNRLIVSVAVNGCPLDGPELETRLNAAPGPDDQIDLESGERHALVAAAFREIAGHLLEVGRAQRAIADRLTGGDVAQALQDVAEAVHVWEACRNAVMHGSGLLGCDLTAFSAGNQGMRDSLSELADKLRELRDALDARDMVVLADLLHYEMPPLCERWHDLLLGLATEISNETITTA